MDRRMIFDALRKVLGRGFRQDEVAAIDRAIDCAAGNSAMCEAAPVHAASGEGIALIRQFEGCARIRSDGLVEAYPDPGSGAEPWTIGWGATGAGIGRGTVWTRRQCDDRLVADVARHAREVSAALEGSPATQAQFDALVSFHYNTGAIARATLMRKHRAGDYAGAAREFDRWCHAGGRRMPGLVRRRAAEAALYRSGHPHAGTR